jgi:protein-glutamine gamma-glutamyltransferase
MNLAGPLATEPIPAHLTAIRRHFEISLYFLLLTGVLTLVSTGKLDLVSILVLPAAMLFKGYRWWRGKGAELSNRTGTWLTIAYFIFFPIDLLTFSRTLAAGAQNPGLYAALIATIHLMLFATVVRLFSATTTRDYLFLSLMAFSSMLASAILTVDTVFLAFFFVFLGLAVSTFVGLEMWRSAQGTVTTPIERGTSAAQRLHNALGITSTGIAAGSLLVGAVIFLILPRFNGGYMSGFSLQPTLVSGFSDDVELGEIGEIKKSSVVVMRVTVDGGLRAARGVHWRGVALTHFDGKRWFNEPQKSTNLTRNDEAGWFRVNSVDPGTQIAGNPIHYTVLLEPIGSTTLFVADETESIRGRFNNTDNRAPLSQRNAYLVEDFTGSIFNPYRSFSRVEYEAKSTVPAPPPAAVRGAGTDYPADIRAMYLQLPALDPRIAALAKQITTRDKTPYDKAQSIEGYLRSNFGYTLDLTGAPTSDPLAYFLFQKRAGHCEYFAAAMAVMLRTLGIPSRYINGFQTGEYNDVAGDLVVRASDAHSWVEAYFPGFGWLMFDPTPPSNEKPLSMMAQLSHYWDWFELQWSEWVINYDFIHQITVAQNLGRASRDWADQIRVAFLRLRRHATDRLTIWQRRALGNPAGRMRMLAMLLALFLCIVLARPDVRQRLLALWHVRISHTRVMTPHLATLQYNEMLRLLARRGIRKEPGQTPMEFAALLPRGSLAEPVFELTSMYLAARFGAKNSDPRRASSLLSDIQLSLQAR